MNVSKLLTVFFCYILVVGCARKATPLDTQLGNTVNTIIPNEALYAVDDNTDVNLNRISNQAGKGFRGLRGMGFNSFQTNPFGNIYNQEFSFPNVNHQSFLSGLNLSNYLPSTGYFSASGTNSPFGSDQSEFYLPPYYGYGYGTDSFLAWAEQERYFGPQYNSFIRVSFGMPLNQTSTQAYPENWLLPNDHCWEFNLESSRDFEVVRQWRMDQVKELDPEESSLIGSAIGPYKKRFQFCTRRTRGGFGIRVKSGYTWAHTNSQFGSSDDFGSQQNPFGIRGLSMPAPNYGGNYSSTNPWQMGYQGWSNNQYHYYPPPSNPGSYMFTRLKMSGKVSQCSTGVWCPKDDFELDLSEMLNSGGVSKRVMKYLNATRQFVAARTISFHGRDWMSSPVATGINNYVSTNGYNGSLPACPDFGTSSNPFGSSQTASSCIPWGSAN